MARRIKQDGINYHFKYIGVCISGEPMPLCATCADPVPVSIESTTMTQ